MSSAKPLSAGGAPRALLTASMCLLLLACSTSGVKKTAGTASQAAEKGDRDMAATSTVEKTPGRTGAGRYVVGKAYQIAGRWFQPKEDPTYDQTGTASWYGPQFHGRRTANGEVFDRAALTAAHPTLPLPSYVRVTNLRNDRSVVVRVNDRGPFSRQRLIDVSERTAELLDFKRRGMAPVRVEYVDRAEVDARDAEFLLASYRGPADALAGGSVQVAAAPPRREGISIPGHLPPPPRKSRPKPPPAMAFDTTQAGVTPPISDAVVVLNSPATAEARILMAFETASANP